MIVAHEAPLHLMDWVRRRTDYDYALVHLFEDPAHGKEYYDFFVDSLNMGRTVILDNSIFELGKAFDMEKFLEWVVQLRPTEYIIPDVLDDMEGTLENVEKWRKLSSGYKLDRTSIGVVQGKTFGDMMECYKGLLPYCDKIAISFNCEAYSEYFNQKGIWLPKEHVWMYGRVQFLNLLMRERFFDPNVPIHLLGLALPQELLYYRYCTSIKSVDSSSPIMHGLEGITYGSYGLDSKVPKPVKDVMWTDNVSPEQLAVIRENMKIFRTFIE